MNHRTSLRRTVSSTAAIAALTFASAAAHAQSTSEEPSSAEPSNPQPDRIPVSFGFVYPLATNSGHADAISSFDMSVLYGRTGGIEGAQLGGVVAHASGDVRGAQVGGVMNLSTGATRGLQLASVLNVTTHDVTGAQIATVNVAGPVDGLQLGVVNVGRKVRGLQLGVVNVAEDVDGAAIGLVSISRDSVHPLAWSSNLAYSNVGVKFTSKYVFTMIGAHSGTLDNGFDEVGGTFAIGGHLPLPESFDLEAQAAYTQTAQWKQGDGHKENTWFSPQIAAGYSFATHLRAFVGGGVRVPISVQTARDVTRPELLAGVQF